MSIGSPLVRILLVEQDEAYAAALETQVNASGRAWLERVSTLDAACEAVAAGRTDAICLDLALPGGFDLGAVDRLRESAADGVVIVVLTRTEEDEDEDGVAASAIQRGAQDYLVRDRVDAALIVRSVRYARDRATWRRESNHREAEILQSHKMEAIGRLAGGIAHDFNNVLTAIFGYSDLLLEQIADEDPRRADVQEIRRAGERAATLTRQLLAFSRKQIMQPRVLSLNDVIASVQRLLGRLVGEDVELEFSPGRELGHVRADPGQVEQVLMNLAANGRDAMPEGGRLLIQTANADVARPNPSSHPGLAPGAYVTMSVTDTGMGVPESVRPHIFEPFFTTKEEGKGTGLGLATVYGIVKQSGGSVYLESVEGQGTRFVVYFPRVP